MKRDARNITVGQAKHENRHTQKIDHAKRQVVGKEVATHSRCTTQPKLSKTEFFEKTDCKVGVVQGIETELHICFCNTSAQFCSQQLFHILLGKQLLWRILLPNLLRALLANLMCRPPPATFFNTSTFRTHLERSARLWQTIVQHTIYTFLCKKNAPKPDVVSPDM